MGGEDVESWHRLSRSLLHVNRLTLKLRHDNSQQPSNFSNGLSGSSRSAIQPTTSLAVLGRGPQFSTLAAGCPSLLPQSLQLPRAPEWRGPRNPLPGSDPSLLLDNLYAAPTTTSSFQICKRFESKVVTYWNKRSNIRRGLINSRGIYLHKIDHVPSHSSHQYSLVAAQICPVLWL